MWVVESAWGFEVSGSYLSCALSHVHGLGEEKNLSEHIFACVKWSFDPNPRRLRKKNAVTDDTASDNK